MKLINSNCYEMKLILVYYNTDALCAASVFFQRATATARACSCDGSCYGLLGD